MSRERYVRSQRVHIIHSLDSVVYQLLTLSFFLSPSLWNTLARYFIQPVCLGPRELDPNRSLKFYLILVFLANIFSVWSHAFVGAAEGKPVVLDFVGLSYVPSRLQLLTLDILILFLQMLQTFIAYEVSLQKADTNAEDILIPTSTESSSYNPIPTSWESDNMNGKSSAASGSQPEYVIDVRLRNIIRRLREPPRIQTVGVNEQEPVLPFPNTAGWPIPSSMRLLMRARQMRARNNENNNNVGNTNRGAGEGQRLGAIPGGLE